MKHRILIVEDEESISEMMELNLELEGYKVTVTPDGSEALQLLKQEKFDLLVLDVMLPGMDGLNVCEALRLEDPNTPVLFVSAKGSTEDRIAGLKKGGDDYLSKPFNLEEFLLKIAKLIERTSPKEESKWKEYHFGEGNSINFESYVAKTPRGNYKLTKREVLLLKLLVDNENEAVSRNHILNTVWGYQVFPSTRTIDNFILAFRKYFETDPKNPQHFISLRGVGYKFCK
jgi:two-component system, OmpR family, alkaline phosphatase synthesis response regulator PhoP